MRLDENLLKRIEYLGEEEHLDRSTTTIRLLLEEGYKNFVKKKAAEAYIRGKLTISKAAQKAGLTIFEMQQYLVSRGFKSSYSVQDLEEELKLLPTR